MKPATRGARCHPRDDRAALRTVFRPASAVALSLVAISVPVRAQADLHVDERAREVAAVVLDETPAVRHLLADQKLVAWLPVGFVALPRSAGAAAGFVRESDRVRVDFARPTSQAGASPFQLLDASLALLRESKILDEVGSIRRIRVASRPAIEVTGRGREGGEPVLVRLLLAADPDEQSHRTVLVRSPQGENAPRRIDAVFLRLLRDWTPLDQGIWTSGFERLRRALGESLDSSDRDRGNRLLDEISKPEAIGADWPESRALELGIEDPALLADGLLHHHPRTRIACGRALAALPATPSTPREGLLAAALGDPDPVVRYRIAQRIAEEPALTTATVERILDADTDPARLGALQLLALAPEALRTALVISLFADPDRLPEASRSLFAALVARWVPAPRAAELLDAARRTSREGPFRRAALLELLGTGQPVARIAARLLLASPAHASKAELEAAIAMLAVHSTTEELPDLERLLRSSESAAPVGAARPAGSEIAGETPDDAPGSHELLGELVDHLASLSERPSVSEECAALELARDEKAWRRERRERLDCPLEPPRPVATLTVGRPGELASALLAMVERLEVGSTRYREILGLLLDRLLAELELWGGDPPSIRSTGFDLSEPLRLEAWSGGSGEGARGASAGWRLSLRAAEAERILDSTLRLAAGAFGPDDVAVALPALTALPLVPTALFAQWDEERDLRAGHDDPDGDSEAAQRMVVLSAAPVGEGSAIGTLLELELERERRASWTETRIVRDGEQLALVVGETTAHAPARERLAAIERSEPGVRAEVDLLALARGLAEARDPADPPDLDTAAEEPRLAVLTEVREHAITTGLELLGFEEDWLAVASNRPVASYAAPTSLLPFDCQLWIALGFNPAALRSVLDSELASLLDSAPSEARALLRSALPAFTGEAGFAMLGPPSTIDGDRVDPWDEHWFAYFSVEPRSADRFLDGLGPAQRVGRKIRAHRWSDGVAARSGEFLVFAKEPEVLAGLAQGRRFSESPVYRDLVTRLPEQASLLAGFDVDPLADHLIASYVERGDESASGLLVESLRALGDIVGWARRDDDRIVGEISIAPRLRATATEDRANRRSLPVEYARSSIGVDWLAPDTGVEEPYAEIEFELVLPPEAEDPGFEWANERLSQDRTPSESYLFRSRAAAGLPERSPVTLPIRAAELQPYLRDEGRLDLDLGELRRLATSIRGHESDPARIVRAIVDWTHDRLEYSVIRRSTSVEEILETRRADCTEFSQLTVALARSLGIPARSVSGIHVGRNAAILHQWTEVHLDRWYEVDSTFGVVEVPATHVRLPETDGALLGARPGARFVLRSIRSATGEQARRVPFVTGAPIEGVALAADGERLLVDLETAGTAGEVAVRTLYSPDGGSSFREIPDRGLEGELVKTFGGHGRLLRLQRRFADTPATELILYELEGETWRQRVLPEGLPSDFTSIQIGLEPGGFLLLLEEARPAIVRVDEAFERLEALELPDSEATRFRLADCCGALASSVEGIGVTVHRPLPGGWAPPISLRGTERLEAVAMVATEHILEVDLRSLDTGEMARFALVGEAIKRHSLRAPEDARRVVRLRTPEFAWTAAARGPSLFLARSPSR